MGVRENKVKPIIASRESEEYPYEVAFISDDVIYYSIYTYERMQEKFGGFQIVENSMVVGNRQDSVLSDVMSDCTSCGKEIYIGEEYRDIDGDYIHDETECIQRYVESHSIKKVAGE